MTKGWNEAVHHFNAKETKLNSFRIGQVEKLVRYPVKSMAGVEMNQVELGWHGLVGDRRFGVRKLDSKGDFPWLTASRMPELLLYRPARFDSNSKECLPTHVQNPAGELLDIHGQSLRDEIAEQAGCNVELMALKHGIFDDAVISLIASATTNHICQQSKVPEDSRRFRANIVLSGEGATPFEEDEWVGGMVTFADQENGPAVQVTKRDIRCKMISLDPDDAKHQPQVLKTAVRLNENHAGVYGTVIRPGAIRTGDAVYLTRREEAAVTT